MTKVFEMRLEGLDGVLETLKSLPPAVTKGRGNPAKAALRKGALVILKQEQANLRAVTTNATASEKVESTGLLAKNLTATAGKPTPEGLHYLVRVRRKTYPRKGGGKPVSTIKTAALLEYGSSQQPAEPWIRPAVAAKAEEAIRTIERELVAGIDAVVKRLEARGRR